MRLDGTAALVAITLHVVVIVALRAAVVRATHLRPSLPGRIRARRPSF
jgi:hypothetical protein